MTYQDFANKFLLELARSYRNKEHQIHSLIDFELWKKIFPTSYNDMANFDWNKIHFNAFALNDSENSLLIVYNIPTSNSEKEAKFIGLRFNNKRNNVLYYTLRRPRFYDEAWDICQYDFKSNQDNIIDKIKGTDSMREFKNAIERMKFSEQLSLYDRFRNALERL